MSKSRIIKDVIKAVRPGQVVIVSAQELKELFANEEVSISVAQPEQVDKRKGRSCNTKDEAQALANFLWNEGERHMGDVYDIKRDIAELKKKWEVVPSKVVEFVKP